MTIEEKKLAYFFSNIVSDNKTMNDGLKQIGYLQQMNNMTWDPQSPRFAKAMFSLGIVKEDIILKNKDFFGPPSDKKTPNHPLQPTQKASHGKSQRDYQGKEQEKSGAVDHQESRAAR